MKVGNIGSEPKNLGNVVNSKGMDCYFIISPDQNCYVSSNRVEEVGMDIYQLSDQILPEESYVDLITVKGYISDSITNEFLTSEISITEVESGINGKYTFKSKWLLHNKARKRQRVQL